MGSGVRGSFSSLQVIIQRVSAERMEQVKRSLISNLAEEAMTQIRLGFERGRAPDGTPWQPLKRPRPRDKAGTKGLPLNDKGLLKNSWTRILQASGFTWQSNMSYARPHQDGARIAHRARTNLHARSGRFISRLRAAKKKGSTRVSFSPPTVQGLPARKMVPEGDLPPVWKNAFTVAANRTLLGYGMAR